MHNKTYWKPPWGSSGKENWRNGLPCKGVGRSTWSDGINWSCFSFQPAKFVWSLHICRTVWIHTLCSGPGLTFRFFSYISYLYIQALNSFTGYVIVLNLLLSLTCPKKRKNKGEKEGERGKYTHTPHPTSPKSISTFLCGISSDSF